MLVQKGELSGSAREIVQKAKEQKVQIQIVDKSRLDAIAPNHQGLIAFASAYRYATVEEILQSAKEKGEAPFIVMLDGITADATYEVFDPFADDAEEEYY